MLRDGAERDSGDEISIVCAVALERWTPEPDGDRGPKALPEHRIIYDARTDELRVEWYSVSTRDWRECQHEHRHLTLPP